MSGMGSPVARRSISASNRAANLRRAPRRRVGLPVQDEPEELLRLDLLAVLLPVVDGGRRLQRLRSPGRSSLPVFTGAWYRLAVATLVARMPRANADTPAAEARDRQTEEAPGTHERRIRLRGPADGRPARGARARERRAQVVERAARSPRPRRRRPSACRGPTCTSSGPDVRVAKPGRPRPVPAVVRPGGGAGRRGPGAAARTRRAGRRVSGSRARPTPARPVPLARANRRSRRNEAQPEPCGRCSPGSDPRARRTAMCPSAMCAVEHREHQRRRDEGRQQVVAPVTDATRDDASSGRRAGTAAPAARPGRLRSGPRLDQRDPGRRVRDEDV